MSARHQHLEQFQPAGEEEGQSEAEHKTARVAHIPKGAGDKKTRKVLKVVRDAGVRPRRWRSDREED